MQIDSLARMFTIKRAVNSLLLSRNWALTMKKTIDCNVRECTSSFDEVEIYNQNKLQALKTLSSSLMEKSFTKEEEKYQQKVSQIIEIFYSLDEGLRPNELKTHEIDYMVKMTKGSVIKNYIKKLARVEKDRKAREEHKQEIKEIIMSRPSPKFGIQFDDDGKPVYKLHCISPICSYAVCKRMRDHLSTRIAQGKILDAPKIVIDFDYDQHLTVKQYLTMAAQIKIVIGIYRHLIEPVQLFFCNFKPESPITQYLNFDFGPPSSYIVDATSSSYLDLFPKEKLVYLTADTDNVLHYDPDDIYIIGGMIDAQTNEPLSAIKSRQEGLRTAKLPLNDHVRMRNEVKSLKIGQVFGIISELASGVCDIKEAIEKYIPYRIQLEDEVERLRSQYDKSAEKAADILRNKFLLTDEETEAMMLLSLYYYRENVDLRINKTNS